MESVLSCFKYQTLSARKAERFLVFCISFYNNASKDTLFQLYPLTWFNLTLNTLVQCRTHTCKKKKKLKGLRYVWQPNIGTVAIKTFCHPPNKVTTRPNQSVHKQATTAPTTHLLVPVHIYTGLYHILFVGGTCSLSPCC